MSATRRDWGRGFHRMRQDSSLRGEEDPGPPPGRVGKRLGEKTLARPVGEVVSSGRAWCGVWVRAKKGKIQRKG